ncbi:MAG: hypothetical protein CVU85_05130 [Firmicutes bacterium HGW-Firmicutes-10]|jgi:predicted amidophosphoribosyltransferase|nr:MAG: hypothetical protein CVU85_05130 [Firmicutes bacterium HGW-Firmicutes-10]
MNEHEEMLQARFESKLTVCPDCAKEVSKLAVTCPHCGRPLQPQSEPRPIEAPQPAQVQGISFWGIVLAVIIAVVILSVL